jgi:hypothetical protein
LRIALIAGACVLMIASPGCSLVPDASRSYGCTKSGRRDTAELRAVVARMSVVTTGFPNTVGRFNECDEGDSTGISIDPFPRGVSLDDAEAAFTGEFDCGTPKRSPNFGYPTSTFECKISTVRAEVALEYTDGAARGFLRPRR